MSNNSHTMKDKYNISSSATTIVIRYPLYAPDPIGSSDSLIVTLSANVRGTKKMKPRA